ncbi:MAG: VWA domain-containing protein [Chitinophagaceae bacterium]|nr:MAG: VWA domain-containing protein [Chitinophagaceae bacterium]
MTLPFDIQLERPEALYLLALLVPLTGVYLLHRSKRKKALQAMGGNVKRLLPDAAPARAAVRFVLFALAFTLGVLALANPRRPAAGDLEARSGIDQVFLLDVSNSMLATDVVPSRLDAAKALLKNVLKARPNDRVALVVFAGHAYAQLPLTYDHGAATLFIETANPQQVPGQGTAIGEALQQALLSFGNEQGRYRTVLLVTDGETHDEQATDAAKELIDRGVMINTIGIGSPGGSTIIDPKTKAPKKDESGNVVLSKLNEPILQQLAAAGKGKYIRMDAGATGASSASSALMAQLSTVKNTSLIDKTQLSYETFYYWLIGPMIFLLLLEAFIPERKKIRA